MQAAVTVADSQWALADAYLRKTGFGEALLMESNLSGRSAVLRRQPLASPKQDRQEDGLASSSNSSGGKQVSISPLSLYRESTAGVWGGRPAAAPGWVRLRLKKHFWRRTRVSCLSCNEDFCATYHPRHEQLALQELSVCACPLAKGGLWALLAVAGVRGQKSGGWKRDDGKRHVLMKRNMFWAHGWCLALPCTCGCRYVRKVMGARV